MSEKKSEDTVQDIPSVDSDNTEPFEGLVETYFQSKGYITSLNKWFWYWQEVKQQRSRKKYMTQIVKIWGVLQIIGTIDNGVEYV